MKRFLLLVFFTLIVILGYPQNWKNQRYEFWGGVSVFHYFGDIGGAASSNNLFGLKDISLKSSRPGINLGGGYWVNDLIYVQVSNIFGIITQTDKGSRNSARDFGFSTIVDEFSVQESYFLIKENKNINYKNIGIRGGVKNMKRIISAYAFAGVGALYFKVTPKDKLIGSSRFNGSKSFTLAIPIGLGARLAFTQRLSFAAELGARLTFTDYLDGFTSQSSKHNDYYYVINFKAIYRFSTLNHRRSITNPFD